MGEDLDEANQSTVVLRPQVRNAQRSVLGNSLDFPRLLIGEYRRGVASENSENFELKVVKLQ